MKPSISSLIEKLTETHSLSEDEYSTLLDEYTPEIAEELAAQAVDVRRRIYGNEVYLRGLIEISNICRNDCLYCGIRRSNMNCARYRLSSEEILACVEAGYPLGFRTFVLQGGEDSYYTDDLLAALIAEIKSAHPDCAVTLSLGERGSESFRRLHDAGADRYLLRHETADEAHYRMLHPSSMSFRHRMDCLRSLREIGYQVGCGFMVGSPHQSNVTLAKDLKFIEQFKPDMCGIGPFIPHHDTPFRDDPAGSVSLTCYLLTIIRLIQPNVLLPATTALGTLHPEGRELGILAGANVVMPNLSPADVRKKYELYDNKLSTGAESAQQVDELRQRIKAIGYTVVSCRGDVRRNADAS